MERNAICNRLEHFICGSIYAHDSNEWRAGQYDIHTNNKDSFFDILQTQTPITFSSHAVTHKVPSHSHLHFELMYLLRGKITHHFGTQTVTLSEGDLLIISPETAHSIDACSKDTIAVNITIKDSFFSRGLLRTMALCGPIHDIFSGVRSGHLHLRSHNNAEAATAADMLLSEFLNPDILSAELVKIYFCSLMSILYRIYTDESCRIYKKKR